MPWSIHVLQIDRSRTDLELVTTLGRNQFLGLGPLSEQVRAIPREQGRPLAAMNGDFYREYGPSPGDPRGLQILQGEVVSAPDGKACFWIDAQGAPHIGQPVSLFAVVWPTGEVTPCGLNEDRTRDSAVLYTPRAGASTRTSGGTELILERAGTNTWLPLRPGHAYAARVRQVREQGNTRLSSETLVLSLSPSLAARLPPAAPGALLKLSTATSPSLSGAQTALGGGPPLVHEGKPQQAFEHKSNERHPRAAIGWNSKFFFLVAVDGRQPDLSIGMTLPQLAGYLPKLGCEEAMNLDGGGSVELWIGGQIVNSPCFGRERYTANALVLLQTDKKPPLP